MFRNFRNFSKIIFTAIIGISSWCTQAQTQTVGTIVNGPSAFDAYTLIYTYTNKNVYLINNCGQKIHQWSTDGNTLIAYLLPNGDLIKTTDDPATVFGGGGSQGYIERYNWNGALQWKFKLSNDSMSLHHDIEVLPNGNILCNVWKKISAAKVRTMGRDTTDPLAQGEFWDDLVLELQPTGATGAQIVWQWKATDHIVQEFDSLLPNYGSVANSPGLLDLNYRPEGIGTYKDWLHFNSVSYNPELDQILLSGHTFDEIYIIDHSTTMNQSSGHFGGMSGAGGDILFRWGNPAAYKQGSTSDQVFNGQHDPHWIKHGEYMNSIITFNNNAGANYSSVDIVTPNFNGMQYNLESSGKYAPSAPNYRYTKPTPTDLYSGIMASAEVLPNGNLYITEATKGKYSEYDINADSIVWEYVNPMKAVSFTKQGVPASQNITFRTYKYGKDYAAFAGKTLTPGAPLELDPWPTACNGIDTTTIKDTTDKDTIKDSTVWVSQIHDFNVQPMLYPNPTSGKSTLKNAQNTQAIEIRNMIGHVILRRENNALAQELMIDLSQVAPGAYTVSCIQGTQISTSRLIILRE